MIRQRSTGMYYIGKSVNIKSRVNNHVKGKTLSLISKAIQEFGVDDFDLDVKYQPHLSPLELVTFEYVLIERFKSMKPTGFNEKCRGGMNTVSEETRAKISAAMKGRKHSTEARKKMSVIAKAQKR